jgi:hypothetical protein
MFKVITKNTTGKLISSVEFEGDEAELKANHFFVHTVTDKVGWLDDEAWDEIQVNDNCFDCAECSIQFISSE